MPAVKYLPVSWNEYHTLAQSLAAKILDSQKKHDEIVAIARGGLTLGLMLTDFLQIPISTITIQSYLDIEKQGVMQITNKLGKSIQDKKILLVDDIADSGKTFIRAVEYLSELHPASVTTVALFYKPHSTFKPDFFAKQTDQWILLPHEITEWIITFTKKMKLEGKTQTEISSFLATLGYVSHQVDFVRKHYFTHYAT